MYNVNWLTSHTSDFLTPWQDFHPGPAGKLEPHWAWGAGVGGLWTGCPPGRPRAPKCCIEDFGKAALSKIAREYDENGMYMAGLGWTEGRRHRTWAPTGKLGQVGQRAAIWRKLLPKGTRQWAGPGLFQQDSFTSPSSSLCVFGFLKQGLPMGSRLASY